jgi:hypothetical protein
MELTKTDCHTEAKFCATELSWYLDVRPRTDVRGARQTSGDFCSLLGL